MQTEVRSGRIRCGNRPPRCRQPLQVVSLQNPSKSVFSMLATLTSIDYGVIGFYLLAMVGLGFYFSGEQRTTQDFFLGGRSFSWFPLGMSLMATLISALSYTGLPGQAYEVGLRCLVIPLSVWLALPILVG